MSPKPRFDLGALIEEVNKVPEEDEEEAKQEAINALSGNIVKLLMPNITDDQLDNITSIMREMNHTQYGGWGGWNDSDPIMEGTNSSRWGGFGRGSGGGHARFNFSALFNRTDFGHTDGYATDSENPFGMARTHSLGFHTAAAFVMVLFVYYVPRMLYYRITRFADDVKTPGFIPIFFLSAIGVLGCIFHIVSYQNALTSEPLIALLSGSETDKFSQYLWKCLTAGINRIVSPIVACVCLQQIGAYTENSLQFANNKGFQFVYCLLAVAGVFGYSFYNQLAVYKEYLKSFFDNYPDPNEINYFEVAFPFITAAIFMYARNKVSRQAVYTTEKLGPQGPTTLDRISKVAVYQVLISVLVIVVYLISPENRKADSWYAFVICGQTPVVHCVLFRSLLRTRKSTRLCFLLCFGGEEQVGTAEQAGMELNQHPQTNEPSQKNEEEGEEEDTQETLDHNKIVLVRESQIEQEEARK